MASNNQPVRAEPMRAVDVVVVVAEATTSTATAELLEGEKSSPTITTLTNLTDILSESEKQADHGWGATEGGAELKDEEAGEAMAKAEQKDSLAADAEPAVEAEPEDNSISYEEYLVQLAEKRLALGAPVPEARKANKGSKQDKKWANAKVLAKEEEEDFVTAAAGKAKRERAQKQKQVVEIDQRFVEAPEQRGGRGGAGGFRGGRGRGDGAPRGGRGEFRGRGDGPRGGGRGGRGDGPSNRGGPRGGRGGASINTADPSAFPSLGS